MDENSINSPLSDSFGINVQFVLLRMAYFELILNFRCEPESLLNCLIKYRANNLAVIRIDYEEKYFVQKNIVDRMPLNNRIAGYGGTIGQL